MTRPSSSGHLYLLEPPISLAWVPRARAQSLRMVDGRSSFVSLTLDPPDRVWSDTGFEGQLRSPGKRLSGCLMHYHPLLGKIMPAEHIVAIPYANCQEKPLGHWILCYWLCYYISNADCCQGSGKMQRQCKNLSCLTPTPPPHQPLQGARG